MKKLDQEKLLADQLMDEFIEKHIGKVNLAGYDKGRVVDSLLVKEEKEFSKFKHAKPSKEGRLDPKKSKIKKFPTIAQALSVSNFGQIFTTPQSDRIYVITRGTWGKKSSNKVVKGFTADTPYDTILGYSKRTKVKHGSAPGVEKELERDVKQKAEGKKKPHEDHP